ncbi:DUF7940 domain-containing protein [Novosphingobium rosa]|uniref:DUF7940 domain-containing protein n=1 Tax=Novosphingobium rosa TaxID=76978 RepID=UPI000834FDF1|nr:hypothetical protein [Novosphingobium rosa]
MRLVDDARQFWRLWSVRVHALIALCVGAVVSDPHILTGLVYYVPDPWRPLAGSFAGIVVFGMPTVARLLKQGGKSDG